MIMSIDYGMEWAVETALESHLIHVQQIDVLSKTIFKI